MTRRAPLTWIFRIVDRGLRILNPKSKIQNPKSQTPSRRPNLFRFLVSGFAILSLALLAPALGMADSRSYLKNHYWPQEAQESQDAQGKLGIFVPPVPLAANFETGSSVIFGEGLFSAVEDGGIELIDASVEVGEFPVHGLEPAVDVRLQVVESQFQMFHSPARFSHVLFEVRQPFFQRVHPFVDQIIQHFLGDPFDDVLSFHRPHPTHRVDGSQESAESLRKGSVEGGMKQFHTNEHECPSTNEHEFFYGLNFENLLFVGVRVPYSCPFVSNVSSVYQPGTSLC